MASQDLLIHSLSTPCGKLLLGAFENQLCLCYWLDAQHRYTVENRIRKYLKKESVLWKTPIFDEVRRQMESYFCGMSRSFDLPLLLLGTPFQLQVWKTLQKIPYGECTTYREVAESMGRPMAVRAVAQAIATNPLQIIVPCHRVVGTDGQIGGYAGGEVAKRHLLGLESGKNGR